MSWPLKYDPASQTISFGGRDKTLYPNTLAPFDQAALAAGDVPRTCCDGDRSRRPSPDNEVFEVEDEKAGGTGSGKNRYAFDTSLHNTTSIIYTKINQLEESRQKRFVESLARGKWNRYRRQYTSNTSHEAHKPTNSLSTSDRTSTFPHSSTNAPYLTPSEARRAALNDQAIKEHGLEDQTIEGGKWTSVSLPASPAAITPTMERDLVIVDVNLCMSEARLSTLTEMCCSPQLSMGEEQAPVGADARTRKERFVFKNTNKGMSRELNAGHKQGFFQRLLHPKENIIKPAIQLAIKVFSLKHNKIQQPEEQPLDVDIRKKVLSKSNVKEWMAKRGYRPIFSQRLVQSVAKAIEEGKEKEKERNAVAL